MEKTQITAALINLKINTVSHADIYPFWIPGIFQLQVIKMFNVCLFTVDFFFVYFYCKSMNEKFLKMSLDTWAVETLQHAISKSFADNKSSRDAF